MGTIVLAFKYPGWNRHLSIGVSQVIFFAHSLPWACEVLGHKPHMFFNVFFLNVKNIAYRKSTPENGCCHIQKNT